MPPETHPAPRPALEPETAVAIGVLCRGANTRSVRLFREWSERADPDVPGASGDPVARFAERLAIAPADLPRRLAEARELARVSLRSSAAGGLVLVRQGTPGYPAWLWQIPDPPVVLWVNGQPSSLLAPAVAVVGSRDATPSGLAVARRLSQGLADAGLTVVSGLARGVDAAAHRGALEAGGRTVAVLGCGADVVYPSEHSELAAEIAQSGAAVSEFLPGSRPLAFHFPLRNRVISGLARAVVVVEASERSGSLITARAALEQGRDVLAVPGGVASGRNRGCHALIKDGARLVETVEDVLEEVGWVPRRVGAGARRQNTLPISDLEKTMALGEPYGLDDLVARTGRQAQHILAELGRLEMAGRLVRVGGGGFVRLDGPAMDRE